MCVYIYVYICFIIHTMTTELRVSMHLPRNSISFLLYPFVYYAFFLISYIQIITIYSEFNISFLMYYLQ